MNDHVYIDILGESVKKHSTLPCLHIKRNGSYASWTYGTFHRDLKRLSSILKKHGLKKGSNAIVIGENTPEWIIAYHAIMLTGACTVPVDPNIPPDEIESIVSTTRAKTIFCSRVYLTLFRELKTKYPFLERIVLLETESDEQEPVFDRYISDGNEDHDPFEDTFAPDDPAVIIFTSGTTGKAKGVVLCQKNFSAVCLYAVPRMKITSNDTVCAVLPLHHVFGCAASMVAPLSAGMDLVCVPYIKGPLILEALHDKKVTYLPAVPKMLQLFYDSILHNVKKKGAVVKTLFSGMNALSAAVGDTLGEGFKRNLFSSVHKGFGGKLRLIISGGAALNKTYWNGFRQLGFTIVEGYGLTETFGPLTVCPGDKPRLGSVGPALPENEIRIHEPDTTGIGEVWLRGSCVFSGYYERDELTREVIDDEGWFHTGDLGKLDRDGYLFLSGRKKDMIVLDTGKNVFPDELEDHYVESPLIEEIGVFGIQQDKNEIVAAVIVPESSVRKEKSVMEASDLLFDELVRMGKSLPVYRRITDFVTVYSPLPRTTTKKLKKNDLRKIYNSIKRKAGTTTHTDTQLSVIEMAMMETDEYLAIVDEIIKLSQKTDKNIMHPRTNLELDLSLDSLDRLDLLSALESHFSVTIPEEVFDKMETITDLVSLVREATSHTENVSVERTLSIKERILNDTSIGISVSGKKSRKSDGILQTALRNAYRSFRSARVSGVSSLTPDLLPFLFVSNHLHRNDLFTIVSSLPSEIRTSTLFLSDRESRTYPRIPYFSLSNHMLTLEKDNDPIEIIKVSLAALRTKNSLVFFPEGGRYSGKEVMPFKPAIGLLALETNVPVVPVRIRMSSEKMFSILFGKPEKVSSMIAEGSIPVKNPSAEIVAAHLRQRVISM